MIQRTESDLKDLVNRCDFRDWSFVVLPLGNAFTVHAVFDGSEGQERSAKQYLRTYLTDEEVFETVWAAALIGDPYASPEEFLVDGEPLIRRAA